MTCLEFYKHRRNLDEDLSRANRYEHVRRSARKRLVEEKIIRFETDITRAHVAIYYRNNLICFVPDRIRGSYDENWKSTAVETMFSTVLAMPDL